MANISFACQAALAHGREGGRNNGMGRGCVIKSAFSTLWGARASFNQT